MTIYCPQCRHAIDATQLVDSPRDKTAFMGYAPARIPAFTGHYGYGENALGEPLAHDKELDRERCCEWVAAGYKHLHFTVVVNGRKTHRIARWKL